MEGFGPCWETLAKRVRAIEVYFEFSLFNDLIVPALFMFKILFRIPNLLP